MGGRRCKALVDEDMRKESKMRRTCASVCADRVSAVLSLITIDPMHDGIESFQNHQEKNDGW